jgi:hypothetical protein
MRTKTEAIPTQGSSLNVEAAHRWLAELRETLAEQAGESRQDAGVRRILAIDAARRAWRRYEDGSFSHALAVLAHDHKLAYDPAKNLGTLIVRLAIPGAGKAVSHDWGLILRGLQRGTLTSAQLRSLGIAKAAKAQAELST